MCVWLGAGLFRFSLGMFAFFAASLYVRVDACVFVRVLCQSNAFAVIKNVPMLEITVEHDNLHGNHRWRKIQTSKFKREREKKAAVNWTTGIRLSLSLSLSFYPPPPVLCLIGGEFIWLSTRRCFSSSENGRMCFCSLYCIHFFPSNSHKSPHERSQCESKERITKVKTISKESDKKSVFNTARGHGIEHFH